MDKQIEFQKSLKLYFTTMYISLYTPNLFQFWITTSTIYISPHGASAGVDKTDSSNQELKQGV